MEEQLITTETAKLAQEKGFNWKVVYYFNEDREEKNNLSFPDDYNKIFNCISRPSQSLLQKWLREIHDIHIEIQAIKGGYISTKLEVPKTYYKQCVYSDLVSLEEETEDENRYDSYEEALEAALQEALKLTIKN